MTQLQLERAVARATGETVATIQGRGFLFVRLPKRRRPRRPRRRHARTHTGAAHAGNAPKGWCQNGTKGQSSTKSFADNAAAKTHANELIAEEIGKGFLEAS